MNNYRFDNGLNWKATLKYDHSRGAFVFQSPMSIIDLKSDANKGVYNYMYRDIDGQTKAYNGQYVQTRMSCLNAGKIDEALFTTELSKKFSTSTFRLGVNEWFYHIDYCSNTTMYDQSIPADGSYALRVWDANQRNGYFYDFNKNASGVAEAEG